MNKFKLPLYLLILAGSAHLTTPSGCGIFFAVLVAVFASLILSHISCQDDAIEVIGRQLREERMRTRVLFDFLQKEYSVSPERSETIRAYIDALNAAIASRAYDKDSTIHELIAALNRALDLKKSSTDELNQIDLNNKTKRK
jgi:hypothetical protein